MCMMSSPKAPPPVALPTPIPAPAAPVQAGDAQVQASALADKKKRIASTAASDTLVTGGMGDTTSANTTKKQLGV